MKIFRIVKHTYAHGEVAYQVQPKAILGWSYRFLVEFPKQALAERYIENLLTPDVVVKEYHAKP